MSVLRDQVIHEMTIAPGWNKADATTLVDALLTETAPLNLSDLDAKWVSIPDWRLAQLETLEAAPAPSVAAPICGEPSREAICNADCTSGCHAAECEHHGVEATFYCILCGTPLLEERRFCAAHEPTPPASLDGLRAALEAISALTLGGERSEAIVTSVGDIARAALRDEGETP